MLGVNFRVAGAIAALLVTNCAVGAADLSTPKPLQKEVTAPASPWEFKFTPYAWLIFVTGDLRLGNKTAGVDTNIFEILDKADHIYAWMSYQELRNGPLALYANVVWSRMRFSDTKSGIIPIGEHIDVSVVANAKVWLDMAIIEPGVTLEVAKWTSGASSFDAAGRAFVPTTAIDLIGGVRYWYLRTDIDLNVGATATLSLPALGLSKSVGGSTNVSAAKTIDWWDPLVGLRLRHKAAPGQELVLQGDIGGFDVGSKLTWQALATYNFQTQFLGFKLNNYIGYRAISIDYEEGSGNRTIGLDFITHGPVVGLTFKW